MGGVLTAANGAVKGSSFRFTIRFDLAGETRRTDRTSLEGTPGRPAAPRRILIVDDSPDNSWLVEVYLKGKQYRLTFEEDGLAAVTRFGLENFDLVLMDIQMPVMDGLTATRAIRELERERGRPRIPILALTASSSLQDMERSFEAGCDAHLAKPISKLELTTAVDRYLREPGSGETAQTKFGEKIRIEVPPGLAQIVPPYLSRRKKEVPEMFDFLAKSDFVRLAEVGRNLKGTGGGYGFLELTHLGSWLEQSAKQQDAEALHKRITDVNDYLDRVQLV